MGKISTIDIVAYKHFKKDLAINKEKSLLQLKFTKKVKYVTNTINENLLLVN